MATVRLDIKTETALKRLTVRRGQTRSEVIREAITRLAEEEGRASLGLSTAAGFRRRGGQRR